ncbi:MAG: hypothetical protein A2V45_08195 [Candidatus Aminicenantes bacterium RBG_19FT_COMBO_58_17]|nr:MAG: hypothetical protein A2V45_08195 [Candidatus Aminicenantes bacterium RBG_19FT_COMBO_58_17]
MKSTLLGTIAVILIAEISAFAGALVVADKFGLGSCPGLLGGLLVFLLVLWFFSPRSASLRR